jgi:hypothetical protein
MPCFPATDWSPEVEETRLLAHPNSLAIIPMLTSIAPICIPTLLLIISHLNANGSLRRPRLAPKELLNFDLLAIINLYSEWHMSGYTS